jgi:hypothetical protein
MLLARRADACALPASYQPLLEFPSLAIGCPPRIAKSGNRLLRGATERPSRARAELSASSSILCRVAHDFDVVNLSLVSSDAQKLRAFDTLLSPTYWLCRSRH